SRRVVVLIDDLDRCEPQAAFQFLEGIKIYLNLPSFVFVLGINQAVIERAIAKHLKDEGGSAARENVAREYFEKLCQDIWHVPAIPSADDFFDNCLGSACTTRAALCQVVRRAVCLPPNPRRIKALRTWCAAS